MVTIPSPSGMESTIQQRIKQELSGIADDINIDNHGNLIAIINKNSKIPVIGKKIMLMAHCDQISMIITHIDNQGYIYFDTIGGWDPQHLVGQHVYVNKNGERKVPGVIGKKPIHLMKPEERSKASKVNSLWVDIGANDKKEVLKKHKINIGDSINTWLCFNELANNNVCGTAFDDKAGIFAIVETAKRIDKSKLTNTVYIVSSVQEEVGLRGAITSTYGVDPDIGIAVDVTFATDNPTHNPKEQGDIKLGSGPVIAISPNTNSEVVKKLRKIAKKKKIQYQLSASGKLAENDARSIQVSKDGVLTGIVSIPNRYMHSNVEMVNLTDLDNIANLLSKFCTRKFN